MGSVRHMNAHILQALAYRREMLLKDCVEGRIPAFQYGLGIEDIDLRTQRELDYYEQKLRDFLQKQ
jgi:hypothetical protein